MKYHKIILTSIIPLLIFLFCFRLYIFNQDFYQEESAKSSNAFENQDLILNNLFNFIQYGIELNPDYFTEQDILHMQDVRHLIWNAVFILTILFLIFIVFVSILLLKGRIYLLGNSFLIGSSISFGLAIILLILSFAMFPALFRWFHLILFDNNLWLMPNSSTLIKLFSMSIFYDMSKKILLNVIYLSLFIFGLGLGTKFVKE
ncbi:MAG: DUF1461 domain-containing protein [Nanoarchaeota archaeon]|nr:DUF1461 domain-containing protein [Nanoarchaeota archaeon]